LALHNKAAKQEWYWSFIRIAMSNKVCRLSFGPFSFFLAIALLVLTYATTLFWLPNITLLPISLLAFVSAVWCYKRKESRRNLRLALFGGVIGFLHLVLILITVKPELQQIDERREIHKHAYIIRALFSYADINNGVFPRRIDLLVREGVLSPSDFYSPVQSDRNNGEGQFGDIEKRTLLKTDFALVCLGSNYYEIQNGLEADQVFVLAFSRPHATIGLGLLGPKSERVLRSVSLMRKNDHKRFIVVWYTEESFRDLIRQQNELRVNKMNLPPIVVHYENDKDGVLK
jgi:hypothetical protein